MEGIGGGEGDGGTYEVIGTVMDQEAQVNWVKEVIKVNNANTALRPFILIAINNEYFHPSNFAIIIVSKLLSLLFVSQQVEMTSCLICYRVML